MKTEYEMWQDELNSKKPRLFELLPDKADRVMGYVWLGLFAAIAGLIIFRLI